MVINFKNKTLRKWTVREIGSCEALVKAVNKYLWFTLWSWILLVLSWFLSGSVFMGSLVSVKSWSGLDNVSCALSLTVNYKYD